MMGQEISAVDLNKILEDHKNWIRTHKKEGKRADLSDATLYANLSGANLIGADLIYANLIGADLRELLDLNIEQLSKVKTLYKAKLDPELMEQVKDKYPHLLDKEDQEYIANMKKAEVAKQTVEEAYKFGLGIQKAVEDKDMKKLLSYVGDKLDLSYFQNKSFDEVFTEEFRTRILSDETGGQRVGWRGWMLGRGAVWYDGYRDSFSITVFNLTKATSSEETPAAWKIDNKYLTPNCFVYMSLSGENYKNRLLYDRHTHAHTSFYR
ncbi:MAG: pentapeptide repeat-containing protein [Candidatus Scalindua sp.]|nr:pentapeptide repeat-containing protein [Candidatus Scalindua sp.]